MNKNSPQELEITDNNTDTKEMEKYYITTTYW